MNQDGSAQSNLTHHPASDLAPAWSPDGSVIAFASNRNSPDFQNCHRLSDCQYEIFLIYPDGLNMKQVTIGVGGAPVWSPDGSQIAFEQITDAANNYSDIFIINADGSNIKNLTQHPSRNSQPVWHPDGERLLFSSSRDEGFGSVNQSLYLIYADGSGLVKLPDEDGFDAQWSPDGKLIAFTSRRHEPALEVYLVNQDFSHLVRLTSTPRHEDLPAWSPDGKWIAYIHGCDYRCVIGLIDPVTLEEKNFSSTACGGIESLSWMPDGEQIVFVCGGETKDIFIVDALSQNPIDLTKQVGDNFSPSVQPRL